MRSSPLLRLVPPLLAACASPEPATSAREQSSPAPSTLERIERVERGLLPPVLIEGEPTWTLADRMRHHGVPGVSVAVIEGFELAWTKAWGVADRSSGAPVTTETLFQASSMSKPITAALTLRLVEQGKLALDMDVRELLTSWRWPADAPVQGGALALERLLSHSAGLSVPGSPGYAPGEPRPTLLETLDGLPPANTSAVRVEHPAGEFHYSGGGYMLLQQALEDRTQVPFATLARELVLEPLGMRRSTFEQPLPPERSREAATGHDDEGEPLPGKWRIHVDLAPAGLWSSAEEYALFVVDLMRGLDGRPARLLSSDTARRMIAARTPLTGLGVFRVGPGTVTDGHDGRYFGHGGANWGYNSLFLAHPESGQGIVVFTNFQGNDELCWEIVRSVAREYGWRDWLPEVLARERPSGQSLARLAGRYRLGADEVLTVEPAGDRLRATPVLDEPFELVPVVGGFFARTDQTREFRFELDERGEGRELLARWRGNEWEEPAPRIASEGRAPSELLAGGEVERGLAAFVALRDTKSGDPALDPEHLETRGRALIARGQARAAAALLEFADGIRPGSASLADAQAEAWLAAGEPERARAACGAVLESLATDFTPTASWRVVFRERAQARLRALDAATAR